MDSPLQVSYVDLPDSPVRDVVYDGDLADMALEASTPQRKRRRIAFTNAHRKRQSRTLVAVSNHTKALPSEQVEGISLIDSQSIARHPSLSPEVLDFPDSSDLENQLERVKQPSAELVISEIRYARFVEAVLADECSFYQLSRKIFVSNGWSSKKNEPVVSVYLIYHN